MQFEENNQSICGVWCKDSTVHLCLCNQDGLRSEVSHNFSPYLWTSSDATCDYARLEKLSLPTQSQPATPLDTLMFFDSIGDMDKYFKSRNKSLPIERLSSVENQYLTFSQQRMFANMPFSKIRRVQVDIEVKGSQGFPNASRKEDRIIAVGISGFGGEKIIELAEFTDDAERRLLQEVQDEILARDPDTIEGHNIFKFDLPYIATRSKMLKIPMKWGRFGGEVSFRKSRLSFAERMFAYTRCDIAGRTVVDTLILVQFYDISAREMTSYTLKASAIHFGISKADDRTYIEGDKISDMFISDRDTFRAYLSDDLRETAGLSEKLLPTYVAQVANFPMTLQECLLRGTGMKVESVFLEKYLSAKSALPFATTGDFIEGALSESYATGVYQNVLHYDVASLYPSLMLVLGKCPRNDYLNIFLKELSALREYRLKYKKLARETSDADLQKEYDARQKSFKILINSFYGYLGLSTAIFGDSTLASEITRTGRELLSKLIEFFRSVGCDVLEADTDGIYLASEKYFDSPEELLKLASEVLPQGVDLEFDGKFDAMLCYKAKNYALMQNGKITLRGSALRNRATEPFLRKLTEAMVKDKLLGRDDLVEKEVEHFKEMIYSGEMSIVDLAKGEFISKSPAQYQADVLKTGKGRRASLEAALQMNPPPEVGDKVLYYITPSASPRDADWKRARPISLYDKHTAPYDAKYYADKIDDWRERFSDLFGNVSGQGELF
ncbi:MAG: DNA polymerase [Opitutales bacterium]|nr:DNA polymerase [Opitutales bacterium]